jgi:hypothetical protein
MKPVNDTEGRTGVGVAFDTTGVLVGVLVGMFVGVLVGVFVGVFVGIFVGVLVIRWLYRLACLQECS